MSITYKIEICNEEIENFSVFVEEIFKTVLECGKLIVIRSLCKAVTPNDTGTKAAAKLL